MKIPNGAVTEESAVVAGIAGSRLKYAQLAKPELQYFHSDNANLAQH